MNTAKEQHWHEMYQRVAQMTDKLGKGIDARIAETVVALNVLGISTQEEMHAFTAFLKECYFSGEAPKEG